MKHVLKTYPPRGSLQQFRLTDALTFHCFRCGQSKTSRLVVVYNQNWDSLLCNACYGRLLSIYNVRAGTAPSDRRADELADLLLKLVNADDARDAARRLAASSQRLSHMSELGLRFLGTSEYLADRIAGPTDLDWSCAVLGLCKAIEIEVVQKVIEPLRASVSGDDLSMDLSDPDLGRIARYMVSDSQKAPELGTISHFVRTATTSVSRAKTSLLIRGYRRFALKTQDGAWLLAPAGLSRSLADIAVKFRNPAVHTETLTLNDFERCREAIAGPAGVLWRLLAAMDR